MQNTVYLDNVEQGKNVRFSKFINMYGCKIGDESRVGAFVEVQKGSSIGNRCKISSHTFICEGVHIDDECFIGHSVVFINDKGPRAVNAQGELEGESDWVDRFCETHIGKRVSIGSNATIMGGISIGEGSLIGAGSVVTKNVPAGEVWAGVPAKFLKKVTN